MLKKISLLLLISILSIGFMGNTYAKSCEDKKDDCYEECEEIWDGDSIIVQIGRAVCKGGCQVAQLACNLR